MRSAIEIGHAHPIGIKSMGIVHSMLQSSECWGSLGVIVASITCCATLNILKAIHIFYVAWVPRCGSILHWWSDHGLACSVTNLFGAISEVALRNPRVREALACGY